MKDIIDLSGFSQASLDAISVDDEVQGLPTGLNAGAMIYNKEFFKKNNISEDVENWDWDKLIEIGKKVHEADSNQYLLNEEELTEVLEYMQKLFDNNVIVPFEQSALF